MHTTFVIHRTHRRRATGTLLALAALVASTLVVASVSPALAAAPDKVNFTLEGCRTPVGDLSQSDYLCESTEGGTYTTGNLGKGWNELDLVPHRLTASAGNSAPSTQTYTVGITADHIETGTPGYDFISAPELNLALSHPSCQLTVGAEQDITPGIGGTDVSLGRLVTITQDKNTTCVVDWVQRLALGSAQYPGASLHTNVTNENFSTQGMGARDVSIPVREILPQSISKTMTAVRGSDHAWLIDKTANPVSLDFGDTCDPTQPLEAPVQITVSWTKLAATPDGDVTIATVITATNPAHRPVEVTVTDRIYEGANQTTLLDEATDTVIVAANTSSTVLTHVVSVASTATTFNDVATATYTDVEFPEIAIPGQTSATASATAALTGPVSNATATITDTETITGDGLEFKVAAPSVGAFTNYTANTWTDDPVGWRVEDVATSGSVTFNKTVRVDAPRATTGTLSDTAFLTGSDGLTTQASASTSISSDPRVSIELVKNIPNVVSQGEQIQVAFDLRDSEGVVDSVTLTFGPGEIQKTHTFTGLVPAAYTLVETDSGGFAPQADTPVNMSPDSTGVVDCSERVTITNSFAPASVRVAKHTLPAGSEAGWQFSLSGPLSGLPESLTTTGTGYHLFTTTIEADGTYTVTETAQGGWDLTKVELDGIEVAGPTCQFSLDFPTDSGRVVSCDFTNTQRGTIIVEKDVVSTNPDANDATFTFTGDAAGAIRDTSTHDDRITVTNLVPGAYTSTEADPTPDFDLTAVACNDGASATASTGDTSTRTATFRLDPGETVTCTFTNTERGMAEVIKRVDIDGSLRLATAGEFTFELRQGASTTSSGTVLESRSTDANGEVVFTTKLVPGTTYNLCEVGMMPGWSNTLDGYTPNGEAPEGADNSSECVDFTVQAGELVTFEVNNVAPPGGDARTIGFWRNWSGNCTNGNQADVLGETLALAGGILIGDLMVDQPCTEAVPLLSKRSIDDGKVRSNDAAYGLAAQLLAAQLNVVADAGSCPAADQARADAQALLDEIGFDGTGSYLDPQSTKGKSPTAQALKAKQAEANNLAATLDAYNNNELC